LTLGSKKPKTSDESLALSAVVLQLLAQLIITKQSRRVVSEQTQGLALARDLQKNQLEAASNVKE